MSQADLAEATGISYSSISGYERGISEPSLFNASCIADALGTSIDYLVGRDNQKDKLFDELSGYRKKLLEIKKLLEN